MKQIQLTDTVMVSDPCYTEPTWCQIKLKNVLPGTYNVEADKRDCSGWGERVHSLQVIHSDYSGPLDWEEAPGDVGVDSGQAGIFSYDSYRNDAIASGIQTEEPPFTLPHREEAGDRWYEKMCEMTLSKDSWGVYDNGVVSSSGIGDGGYPLFIVRDRSGFIVAMRVEFLSDEEEYDECPECGAEMDMGDEICESCQNEKEYNANI
jgi:hypothetical protein